MLSTLDWIYLNIPRARIFNFYPCQHRKIHLANNPIKSGRKGNLSTHSALICELVILWNKSGNVIKVRVLNEMEPLVMTPTQMLVKKTKHNQFSNLSWSRRNLWHKRKNQGENEAIVI